MTKLMASYESAIEQDPSICTSQEDLDTAKAVPEDMMLMLGLSKIQLKRLERKGLAVRGYRPRRPVHRYVKDLEGNSHKRLHKHSGFERCWILLNKIS